LTSSTQFVHFLNEKFEILPQPQPTNNDGHKTVVKSLTRD